MGHPPRCRRHPRPQPGWTTGASASWSPKRTSEPPTEPTLRDLQRGAHRRLRDGLRHPQPDLDLPVHRRDPAGRDLPRETGAARRRRRPHPPAGRRPGPPDGRAGCGQPRMEAGPGGQRNVARRPSRYLSRGAPPGRPPRVLSNTLAAGRPSPRGRPHEGVARRDVRAPRDGRTAQAIRRHAVRPRHRVRPRRGTPAARTSHARSRPRDTSDGPVRVFGAAPRRPAGAARPRFTRAASTSPRGRTGFARSRLARVRGSVGAAR